MLDNVFDRESTNLLDSRTFRGWPVCQEQLVPYTRDLRLVPVVDCEKPAHKARAVRVIHEQGNKSEY
jgi:hypothetical protein